MKADAWDPDQYERFRQERSRPFHDLAGMLRASDRPRVLDLGCGTGALTRGLHERLGAASTLGIDRSPAMLEKARAHASPETGLEFAPGDIADPPTGPWDIVFSNAALHWSPDHPALLARLRRLLAKGGQLAVQVPANGPHPSHALAHEVAQEPEFATALDGFVSRTPVLAPERYSELLHDLGFRDQEVCLRVYGHSLPDRGAVVEWVKGTTLKSYEERLPPELFARYLARYTERLTAALAAARPFFYTFRRILFWAR